MFFRWRDRHGQRSDVFTFADRNGGGKDASTFAPALSHNALMAHSIRGRVTNANEGPRYCVACHLTTDGMTAFGETAYADFYDAYEARNYAALDFDMLQIEIGRNPGNQRNSPIWVHMVAGLGSGLFLFDAQGRPVNSLDEDDDRKGTENQPPADQFLIDGVTTVALDLDRVVEPDGKSNASSNHALLNGAGGLRDGASDQTMSGPLGASLVERLAHPTNGVRLDAWLDANSDPQGGAAGVLTPP
jgi:hypothetical protein